MAKQMVRKLTKSEFITCHRELLNLYYLSKVDKLDEVQKPRIRELELLLCRNIDESYPITTLSRLDIIGLIATIYGEDEEGDIEPSAEAIAQGIEKIIENHEEYRLDQF